MSNEQRVMSKEYTLEQRFTDAAELQYLIKSALGDAGADMSESAIVGAVDGMRRQLMPLPGEDKNPVSEEDMRAAFVTSPQDLLKGKSIGRLVAMACRQGHLQGEEIRNV